MVFTQKTISLWNVRQKVQSVLPPVSLVLQAAVNQKIVEIVNLKY